MIDIRPDASKTELRRLLRRRRSDLQGVFREDACAAIAGHCLEAINLSSADLVAGYWPIRDEVDCLPLLRRLREQGHTTALPVITGVDQPLRFKLWTADAALGQAEFGTMVPPADAPDVQPDIILLPVLGFDRAGTRLGYGGGYYDRTLAALPYNPRLIGLAYSMQQLDRLPREPHDVPLDMVVTEMGVLKFGPAA